ncbi:hypothetical protein CROQUDRAFT_659136 [Cronartium quercuum f. sp. fusiforme G11]|uniref:Uncharacterized protein n=1 Tax=Cronartium quercuum f. sp. fusiforme G11 TaxID=708437 RepID=A0A9P6NFF7_9BASI|nr:hypothetical protein CROQUDRAFT_659136 [Cronartium quercuum f. sp. fusiforme G11]
MTPTAYDCFIHECFINSQQMIYLNFIQQNPKLKLKEESTPKTWHNSNTLGAKEIFKRSQQWSIHMKSATKRTFKNSQVVLQRVLQIGKAACACRIFPSMSQPDWKWLSVADFNKQETELLRKRSASLSGTSDTPPITPTPAIVEARNFRKDAMLIFNAEAPNEFGDVEELVKAVQVFEDEKNTEFFLTLSEAIRWRWVRSKIALNSK